MMIDNDDLKFNFGCASCGYKEEKRRIPVSRVIKKLDELLSKNEMDEVTRLLNNWRREAVQIGDLSGELSIVNEQLGHFRKVQNLFHVKQKQKQKNISLKCILMIR